MGKVLGILMFVVAVWSSTEIYNKGTAGAFGGILVTAGFVEPATAGAAPATAGHRAGAAVSGAHAEADARRDRMLAE